AAGHFVPALLLFAMLAGTISFWFSPLVHVWSRRFEYEADAFARVAMGETQSLIQALRKLTKNNLSNLTPPPLYSSFYYSHPTLIDPGPLPHPLAASTDISKAVRAAYGADEDYTELAERSIKLWRKWNEEFGIELYHETGVIFVRRREMKPGDFEYESFKTLQQRGHKVERMNSAQRRFPAWNPELFRDGIVEVEAGYAESGRAI